LSKTSANNDAGLQARIETELAKEHSSLRGALASLEARIMVRQSQLERKLRLVMIFLIFLILIAISLGVLWFLSR
jgi:hypothetical protein